MNQHRRHRHDATAWKVIKALLFIAFCLFAIKAMSWADEGVRGPTKTVERWPWEKP